MDKLDPPRLGISGRIAAYFQTAQITPLLALVALLLGVFAVLVTPREEEPQINVTMANVLIPFPGASARDVEQMVAGPAEQVLAQLSGVEMIGRKPWSVPPRRMDADHGLRRRRRNADDRRSARRRFDRRPFGDRRESP